MKRDVPHFRIGLLLTEAGILAPQQLDEAIVQSEQKGTPFLRLLITEGALKQHELQAVIRAQSLIWSGLLDVDRAIKALNVVHTSDVSIDEGLRCVGWSRPEGSLSETVSTSVRVTTESKSEAASEPRPCQYCGTILSAGSTLCAFCTGENSRGASSNRIHIEPAWQRQAVEQDAGVIRSTIPPRDPALMAFFSGLLLPGLGQLVIGQSIKGLCLIIIATVMALATKGASCLFLFPLCALDAYLLAEKLKQGKAIGPWEFL